MSSSIKASRIRWVLVVFLLAALGVPPGLAQEPPDRFQGAYEAIDAAVRRSMAEHRTPGLALAVTSRDRLLFHRSYGFADLKLRAPVTPETLFQIGSISKSFTAVALLQLADAERFDPHRPVTSYLPWFSVRSDHGPITAHHLLSHTAGIPANRDAITSSRFMAWAVRDQGTAWAPGSRFHYSNVGYQVLHALLEQVAGRPYAELVRERIFEPLKMSSSAAEIRLDSRSAQAIGYVHPYDDRPPHRSRPLAEAPFGEYRIGDGSILSTATDMAAYVRMLLNRGAAPGGRLLSKDSFERFATPYTERPREAGGSYGYGYGIGVLERDDRRLLTHSGGMLGLYADITADMTEGFGAAAMANGPGAPWKLATFALDALRAAARGEPMPAVPEAEDSRQVENAADYAGLYESLAGEKLRFEADGETLLLRHGDGQIVLEKFGRDTFYTPHPDFDRHPFRFVESEAGAVAEITRGADWYAHDRYDGPREFPSPPGWQAYVGRYRNYSPWFPYFEIVLRKGRLIAITGVGGESSYDETVLDPLAPGLFHLGEEPTPETLRFEPVVDGQALSAVWSGHRFFLFDR